MSLHVLDMLALLVDHGEAAPAVVAPVTPPEAGLCACGHGERDHYDSRGANVCIMCRCPAFRPVAEPGSCQPAGHPALTMAAEALRREGYRVWVPEERVPAAHPAPGPVTCDDEHSCRVPRDKLVQALCAIYNAMDDLAPADRREIAWRVCDAMEPHRFYPVHAPTPGRLLGEEAVGAAYEHALASFWRAEGRQEGEACSVGLARRSVALRAMHAERRRLETLERTGEPYDGGYLVELHAAIDALTTDHDANGGDDEA